MLIFAIGGKFYTIKEKEFSGDYSYCPEVIESSKNIINISIRDMTFCCEYVIDFHNGFFKITKNRYEGQEVILFSFDNVIEYINKSEYNKFKYNDKHVHCLNIDEISKIL